MLDRDKSILIKGAKVKAGDLVIESQPGTDSVNVSDYESDPGKVIDISDYINGASWSAVAAAEANSWRSIAAGSNSVWCAVSDDGTNRIMRSTDNGLSWSAISEPESTDWISVATDGNGVWCAVATLGVNKVMRSIDNGASWGSVAAAEANSWQSVATDGNGIWCAVSNDGTNRVMRSTDNGASWGTVAAAEANLWRSVATDGNGIWCAVASVGTNRIMRSIDDGASWSAIAAPEANIWISVATDGNGVWCAVASSGTDRVMRSINDGASWSGVSAAEANTWSSVATDGNGIWCAVSVGGTNRVMRSTDNGVSWVAVAEAEANFWRGVATNNLGVWCAVSDDGTNRVMRSSGGLQAALDQVNGTTTTAIQIDQEDATYIQSANLTLSANTIIQGFPFTLSGFGFDPLTSFNLTLQNCIHPFALTGDKNNILDHCNVTLSTGKPVNFTGQCQILGCWLESDDDDALTLTNNVMTITDTLCKTSGTSKESANLDGTAATLADIDIEQNTFIGDFSIDNTGGTGKERMRDNIFNNDVESVADFTMDSGNIFGSSTGFTLAYPGILNVDPLFADATTYKVQREVDGFGFDSPMVRASFYTNTSQGNPRDMGAWNIDDSGISEIYSLAFYIPRPGLIVGGGSVQKGVELFTREEVAISGALDVYSNPERQKDIIIVNYAQLKNEYWEQIKTLLTKKNLEVFLSLDPTVLIETDFSVTANGLQSSGAAVLNITSTKQIPTGSILDISGTEYRVIYPVPLSGISTSLVLDRVLESDVADLLSITVDHPIGGIYKLSPPQLTFEDIQESEMGQGLQLKFVRKRI